MTIPEHPSQSPAPGPAEKPDPPSDAQLQAASDRIRRLSGGIDTPDERSSDLATFSEEALRRTYRIMELGIGFWMSLLRLNPGRRLDEDSAVPGTSASDPGWLFGRTLGAMIRSWGDLKNAQRGLLWFDSSPLLGPKVEREVHRSNLVPVVRLMTETTVAEIAGILKVHCGEAWNDGVSEELLWLGLQAGALEREQRNPQGTSESFQQQRMEAVLAFSPETDYCGKQDPLAKKLLVESRTKEITIPDRRDTLRESQGGRDTYWRPLYSFLRRGDVIAITLAGKDGAGKGWGTNWASGRPFALAVVTAPAGWDQGGWWGRIGCVLLLDGPTDGGDTKTDPNEDRERLRTAFRFPAARPLEGETDELLETFGLIEGKVKSTNDLGLERTRMFRDWLGAGPDDGSGKPSLRIVEELAEPIPDGFPGPWRLVNDRDLRATLGEFLEPHAATVGYFEHRELVRQLRGGRKDRKAKRKSRRQAGNAWLAWYSANLNIERFALTSDNLRLGVIFDGPLDSNGRTSIQRIAPDPVPNSKLRIRQQREGKKRSTGSQEERRIRAADAHRLSFDHFKRGMKAGRVERPLSSQDRKRFKKKGHGRTPEQERAAAFLPTIRLYPNLNPKKGRMFMPGEATGRLWTRKDRENEEATPPNLLTDNIEEWFRHSSKEGSVSVAAFPEAEKIDLYRATDARYFTKRGLVAEQGRIAIDPAGTRVRQVVLITSPKRKSRLLIILTDDSVAAVDVGAIVWMLVAYGRKLEKQHVLDIEAYSRSRQRNRRTSGEKPGRSEARARKLARDCWQILHQVRLDGKPE